MMNGEDLHELAYQADAPWAATMSDWLSTNGALRLDAIPSAFSRAAEAELNDRY